MYIFVFCCCRGIVMLLKSLRFDPDRRHVLLNSSEHLVVVLSALICMVVMLQPAHKFIYIYI